MTQRIAYVTGGTGGIGRAICTALAGRGCRVAALGHPADADAAAAWQAGDGAGNEVALADLADPVAAEAALADLYDRAGTPDILVNAAGITRDARFAKMTPAQWREVMAANLDAAFHVTQPLFAGMCERGFGRIVNIASVNGSRGQFGQANYAASKAGLHGLTMSLAREGARYGVTANTVSPGYIATAMTAGMRPDVLEAITGEIPAGRLGEPAEVARAVAFLCDDGAGYVTGANLPVNGGLYMGF